MSHDSCVNDDLLGAEPYILIADFKSHASCVFDDLPRTDLCIYITNFSSNTSRVFDDLLRAYLRILPFDIRVGFLWLVIWACTREGRMAAHFWVFFVNSIKCFIKFFDNSWTLQAFAVLFIWFRTYHSRVFWFLISFVRVLLRLIDGFEVHYHILTLSFFFLILKDAHTEVQTARNVFRRLGNKSIHFAIYIFLDILQELFRDVNDVNFMLQHLWQSIFIQQHLVDPIDGVDGPV